MALAYVMEEGLPKQFSCIPVDLLEAAAKRLHDMGYKKVGLWGISKGAELALTAGSQPESGGRTLGGRAVKAVFALFGLLFLYSLYFSFR